MKDGLKSESAALDQIRSEKELYERLQNLQNEVSSSLGKYAKLRDGHIARQLVCRSRYPISTCTVPNTPEDTEYHVLAARLVTLVAQYNRLEAKLAQMESRKPRWFVLPLAPTPPNITKIESSAAGNEIHFYLMPDELLLGIEADLRTLFKEYAQPIPEALRLPSSS